MAQVNEEAVYPIGMDKDAERICRICLKKGDKERYSLVGLEREMAKLCCVIS